MYISESTYATLHAVLQSLEGLEQEEIKHMALDFILKPTAKLGRLPQTLVELRIIARHVFAVPMALRVERLSQDAVVKVGDFKML